MKTILLVAILLFPTATIAANLTCTVPQASVARAVELCEALRQSLRVPSSRWSNDICATEFLRIGLRSYESSVTNREARAAVVSAVADALSAFDANHPIAVVPAVCGDGTTDTEFGEECDDGNTASGDGCDAACATE